MTVTVSSPVGKLPEAFGIVEMTKSGFEVVLDGVDVPNGDVEAFVVVTKPLEYGNLVVVVPAIVEVCPILGVVLTFVVVNEVVEV